MSVPPHLGGHHGITHVDAVVFGYLWQRYAITSMIDVGCGPGGMLDLAGTYGVSAIGIDGDPTLTHPAIRQHDYTTGPCPDLPRCDLVWSVEFVEHVAEEYLPHVLATFAQGRVLFLTHAVPGQVGHHHVNCQPESYWRDILSRAGWIIDEPATAWVRTHATDVYTKATGMVWTR